MVIPAISLRVILGKVLLCTHSVKVMAGLHPLIVTAPVIKMLVPVVIKPMVVIPELIMVKMIYSCISRVITTVPMTVKCYAIISCTVIIVVHKWPWCTNLEPAGISPVKITVRAGQVGS